VDLNTIVEVKRPASADQSAGARRIRLAWWRNLAVLGAAGPHRAGESFFEMSDGHDKIGENASDTAPARLLAVFVVDPAETTLAIPDPR
jgi:hypothetical protein